MLIIPPTIGAAMRFIASDAGAVAPHDRQQTGEDREEGHHHGPHALRRPVADGSITATIGWLGDCSS